MKKYLLSFPLFLVVFIFLFFSCKSENHSIKQWEPYDEAMEISENTTHEIKRMRYRRLQSLHTDKNTLFFPFKKALATFSMEKHDALKPLILEQDIPSIQDHIEAGRLTYQELSLFYLFRIYHFELQRETYLNAIIALNPTILEEAAKRDRDRQNSMEHPLYGMPILLKDNINTANMPTTAGAAAFQNNQTEADAFVVGQLKAKGALILGKVNLSEWAYYFCSGCPVGYSAMGGQTLNPYGRRQFETGGSSSGSGVSIAANYAVAALGSETSGSILSPSGKNSLVGLKPTIGAVSRSGIVPISSTLDTSGPMTKNVMDNAILMNAMVGIDPNDSYSYNAAPIAYDNLKQASLKGKRLGVIQQFAEDTLLLQAIEILEDAGASITFIDPPKIDFDGFRKILDVDMKKDLPAYIEGHASSELTVATVKDIVAFNNRDSLLHAPYGQTIFKRIAKDTTTEKGFKSKKQRIMQEAKRYFETPMQANALDAVISINNYSAGFAAAAHYPALGVPMGYDNQGEPFNITFIAPSKQEQLLFELGAAFERLTKHRKTPLLFQ